MATHESDTDIQTKLEELTIQEGIAEQRLREIRNYQRCINELKMVKARKINEDGTTATEIVFVEPRDYAGNEMDVDYKNSQKTELIVNIDKFLSK